MAKLLGINRLLRPLMTFFITFRQKEVYRQMKIQFGLVLCFAVLIETVWTSNRRINCSINETAYFEVNVNDIQNEVFVNCRNASIDIKLVVECTQIRSIELLVAHHCNLHASLSSSLLHVTKSLSLMNVITENRFSVNNLNIQHLYIQGSAISELHLNNLLLLKYLTIVNMNWRTVLGNPFEELYGLLTLSMSQNQLEYFDEDTFYHLRRLLILNLSKNRLRSFPEGLFRSMNRLSYLYLAENSFLYLNSSALFDLRSLTYLDLSRNVLSEISKDLVSYNPELQHINLSQNPNLKEIPEEIFKNSRKLSVVNMSSCGLLSFPADIFKACPLMKILSLANNGLEAINPDTYFSFSLSFLDLSNNSLKALPSGLFGTGHRLQYLNLSRNGFDKIPTNAFSGMFTLSELNMGSNYIEAVTAEDFDFLTNLLQIDLSNNRIWHLASLGKATSLLRINLSSNAIKTFPDIPWRYYNVEIIDISNNDINRLTTKNLSFKATSVINLRNNKITSFNPNHTSQHRVILYLESNPLSCDCFLVEFVRFIQTQVVRPSSSSLTVADADNITCNSPLKWKDEPLIRITPFHVCPVDTSCPTDCRCYQLKDFAVLVNCSFVGMTDFPVVIPQNSSILHFENNLISSFNTPNSKAWLDVTHLYLDNNQLASPKHWIQLRDLKVLSLRNNNLTTLPDDLQTFVSTALSFRLDIRGNPWECVCSFLPFKIWFMKNLNKLVNPEEVTCTRLVNNTLTVYTIQETPVDAFCSHPLHHDRITQIIVATVLSVISLLIILAVALYYRYRETVLAYTYVHIPFLYCCKVSSVDRNKLFDAFISYTGPDRDTVLTIIEELENKPPYFKICIHERDWMAGYPITSQIETSVRNSKKTIVILTKKFLDSFWCETEFQAAYMQSLEDRIDRMIIIVKGDLPERETMPLDMQNLLTSKTYLVWGEKWFWEKLRYALPHYAFNSGRNNAKVEEVEGMILDLMQQRRND